MPSFSYICHPNKVERGLFFLKITCFLLLPFLQKPRVPVLCQDPRLRGCPLTSPLCQAPTHPHLFPELLQQTLPCVIATASSLCLGL